MLVEGLPLPVVEELQCQAEVVALHQGDDRLQVILLLGRDAQFLALHLGPDSLRPFVPDELGDLPGVVGGDALLEADPESVLLAGESRVAGIEGLERDAALDQLLLEHVEYRLGPLLAVGADVDGLVPGPGDGCAHAAEVEPGAYLLGGLVEGVVDFLPIDTADDVERRLGGHRCSFSGRALTDGQEVTALRRGAWPGRRVAQVDSGRCHRVNRLRHWGVRLKGASQARPTPGAVQPRPRRLRLPGDAGGGDSSARLSAPSRLSFGPRDGAVFSSPPARRAGGAGAGRSRIRRTGQAKVLAVTCTCRKQPEGPLSFTVPSCG